MFDEVTLRGVEGSIAWGYHTAAVVTAWTITKAGRGGAWALSAVVARADPFKLRQADLKFTAPRKGGYFCWPVLSVTFVEASRLAATLGPPES